MLYFNNSFYYAALHGLFASTESAARLFGFWAPSGDEITVLKIDTDSFRYFFLAIPLVVSLFFVTLPKEFKKAAI